MGTMRLIIALLCAVSVPQACVHVAAATPLPVVSQESARLDAVESGVLGFLPSLDWAKDLEVAGTIAAAYAGLEALYRQSELNESMVSIHEELQALNDAVEEAQAVTGQIELVTAGDWIVNTGGSTYEAGLFFCSGLVEATGFTTADIAGDIAFNVRNERTGKEGAALVFYSHHTDNMCAIRFSDYATGDYEV